MVIDEDGAINLLAAIAKRALLDATNDHVDDNCRADALDFLAAHFPKWREWWKNKPSFGEKLDNKDRI